MVGRYIPTGLCCMTSAPYNSIWQRLADGWTLHCFFKLKRQGTTPPAFLVEVASLTAIQFKVPSRTIHAEKLGLETLNAKPPPPTLRS